MFETILQYLFLFCVCATGGWLIEVIYRGIRHRKVVNPGFLTGCSLPMYGVGGILLYFVSSLRLRQLPNEFCRVAVILLSAALLMTLIEFFGGLIAVKYFRVRLWDYSGEWLNFYGIICPKFSLIWALIGATYFFLLYPVLHRLAVRVPGEPAMVLFAGFYLGVFLVDLAHSLRIMQRVRKYAAAMRTRINLDQLKVTAKEYFKKEIGRKHAPFNFYSMVNRYMSDIRDYRADIQKRFGDKNEKE